jgi:hypothetical protein
MRLVHWGHRGLDIARPAEHNRWKKNAFEFAGSLFDQSLTADTARMAASVRRKASGGAQAAR